MPVSTPHRFARRLFTWFMLATVLPLLLLGGLAYHQVHQNLTADNERQLHRIAKTIGMNVFARLEELEAALQDRDPRTDAAVVEGVQAVVEPDRLPVDRRPLPGAGEARTLLTTRYDAYSGSHRVLLLPRAWRARYGPRYAVSVAPGYLRAPEELVPSDVAYCLVPSDSRPVVCTGEEAERVLSQFDQRRRERAFGTLAWELTDESGLGAYWSLFLRERFSAPDWAVLVTRNDKDIFASLGQFRELFPRVMLLAIGLAVLLASVQLRQRLRPLGQLVDATRSFSDGDFSARVSVDSSDELAQLADAFNVMAAETDLHFKRLAALAELDRVILSSFDEKQIIGLTLGRIGELIGDPRIEFLQLSPDVRRAQDVSRYAPENAYREQPVFVPPALVEWLRGAASAASLPERELGHGFDSRGPGHVTLFPVTKQGRCFGAVLADGEGTRRQPEHMYVVKEFADRLAVALSNAAWQGELYHQAHYDALTGLPNRAILTDRLQQAVRRADRAGGRCAILFVDLDGFKSVNDTLGHHIGDIFLSTAAARLREAARQVDAVVRFGGDEFVVLVSDLPPEIDAMADLSAVAQRLIKAVSEPVELDGHRLALGASIGIAVYPGDGADGADLLRNADAAMYHAKVRGRGHAEFYAAEMNKDALERLSLQQELTDALAAGDQLFLEYQPQVCARTGALVGIEALTRWRHPTRGLVSPGTFIPIAEKSGLIVPLGEWVLQRALETVTTLADRGLVVPRLAVNVASEQLWAPDFPSVVQGALARSGVSAEVLELEVTEGTVMQDLGRGKELLARLCETGVQIAVDDFGTGYSSLSYLQWLPLHRLKIDRSFVTALDESDTSRAIVAAIVDLGKRLGLGLIAEGVETEAQADTLRSLTCDEFQGYLISRPLDIEALVEWYWSRQPDTPWPQRRISEL